MDRIKLESGYDKILAGLPDSWGVFAFYKGDECLLYSKSGNLRFRLCGMYQQKDSDRNLSELFLEADSLSYKVFPEPIYALIQEKIFLKQNQPLMQHKHIVWKNYCYLAIDPMRYPFVGTKDDTNDSWQYIGPFRSRFFLSDIMDTNGRILKIPFCQSPSYPCERLDRDICKGYCRCLDPEYKGEESLVKLGDLLKEAYLHPNNGILELIQKDRDRYFDDLEFDKVDLLADEIDLLKKYRDWLSFLYIAKDMTFENDLLIIEAGQIKQVSIKGKTHSFPITKIQYRENETLALNKDIVDECRIVYTYLQKQKMRG